MRRIPVLYSAQQAADDRDLGSPSAEKPKLLAQALAASDLPIEFIAPRPVTRDQLALAHDRRFVDGVLDCELANGFGTISRPVADSLPYTTGAMLDAALRATPDLPSAALVSGFHHAGYAVAQLFCTFNGLMVTAIHLLREHGKRVAILDADFHFGNGTEQILGQLGLHSEIWHYTFGKHFQHPEVADAYLRKIPALERSLRAFAPDLILYQAGADVHIADPLGGLLSDEQIFMRDVLVCELAQRLGVALCWNLAGGYQRDEAGSIAPVLRIHVNTFVAAQRVYGLGS